MPASSVLVPGLCIVASAIFQLLVNQLNSVDVKEFRAFDLRSVDPSEKLLPSSFEADVAALGATLADYIERDGLDILLVAHSYGGAPSLAAAAAAGLWKPTREKQGKKGGMAKIALISAALHCLARVLLEFDRDISTNSEVSKTRHQTRNRMRR